MRLLAGFALMAMVPAALNIMPAHAATAMVVPICSGDGVARSILVPTGPAELPGKAVPGCCAKGCQAGESRKKGRKCCPE